MMRWLRNLTVSVNDTQGQIIDNVRDPLNPLSAWSLPMQFSYPHWHDLYIRCCEAASLKPFIRFVLAAQYELKGRYILQYTPFFEAVSAPTDNTRRFPMIEWDFSQTHIMDVEPSDAHYYQYRPVHLNDVVQNNDVNGSFVLPQTATTMGTWRLVCMEPVRCLSIFPDTYSISMFMGYRSGSHGILPTAPHNFAFAATNNSDRYLLSATSMQRL